MLEARVETIEKKFSAAEMRKNEKHMLFYTGLDVQRFNWLSGQCTKFPTKTKLLLADDHLLAVLMRLRRSFTIKDLAYRFNVREATMSKVKSKGATLEIPAFT